MLGSVGIDNIQHLMLRDPTNHLAFFPYLFKDTFHHSTNEDEGEIWSLLNSHFPTYLRTGEPLCQSHMVVYCDGTETAGSTRCKMLELWDGRAAQWKVPCRVRSSGQSDPAALDAHHYKIPEWLSSGISILPVPTGTSATSSPALSVRLLQAQCPPELVTNLSCTHDWYVNRGTTVALSRDNNWYVV